MSNNNDSILKYKPVQRFVEGVGPRVLKYVGKDKTCVIALGEDGIFFGDGLYQWLKKQGASVVFAEMAYDGSGLDESKVMGRKVLVVDNGIITGTAYTTSSAHLKERQKDLKIKDIKYAVMRDRTRLADFSVEDYTARTGAEITRLDSIDFKIFQLMGKDGRVSFAKIAAETGLTVSGAKKRVEKLIRVGMLQVRGQVVIKKFYSVSAVIEVEVDLKRMQELMDKLRELQLVYLLLRTYAHHNLLIGVVASKPAEINEFVEKHVNSALGVKSATIHLGDIPILPSAK